LPMNPAALAGFVMPGFRCRLFYLPGVEMMILGLD
jgi:hypothetical protein